MDSSLALEYEKCSKDTTCQDQDKGSTADCEDGAALKNELVKYVMWNFNKLKEMATVDRDKHSKVTVECDDGEEFPFKNTINYGGINGVRILVYDNNYGEGLIPTDYFLAQYRLLPNGTMLSYSM